MKPRTNGFTLVELLVTLIIIAALASLSYVGIRSAREKARTVVEINAARNLITGYLGYAAENSGNVLAGYQTDLTATNLEGELLSDPMNARYPWRLAPSVPSVKGTLLFNGTESALEETNRDYLVSVHPNLGINAILVGGHFGSGSPLKPTERLLSAYGKFYLSNLTEADEPEKLIVFASARSGENKPGYFEVRSPNLTGKVWTGEKFKARTEASSHGFVDFRWGGKAVTVMLGGNVQLHSEDELRDMRLWSHQAARAHDKDYLITRQ